MHLDSLRKVVESKVTSHLEIFFTGKTPKPDCPLRSIVSEKDTWQETIGNFLQSNLQKSKDHFLVRSSTEVVRHLKEGFPMANRGFSIDIEDLFYSLPHDGLFAAIRQQVQETGEVAFQNTAGTGYGLLEILQALDSVVITGSKRLEFGQTIIE
ncbi:hypothetical protein HPB49_019212 [Dermacentor silvarum]|uniref:Uncharacterized protein n=1 Tax=Dermacentor silvarum TaxID=543639 RepID=A0ACB8CH42_DERSI|nr:hypothetical protein HPB49_019212 [Dermacentor silvarum]